MNKVLSVIAAVVCAGVLFAQADANKGQIAGTVFDARQAVVPNAKIRIVNTSTNAVREITSGSAGEFRALLPDPGQYRVTIDAPGFATTQLKGVVVNVGTAVDLPVTLAVGTTTQTIEVTETLTT